jgi:hypothetical protein
MRVAFLFFWHLLFPLPSSTPLLPPTTPTPVQNLTLSPTPALPPKLIIKTTFVPQSPLKDWQQPWQDACEEAALLTVDYFYRQTTTSAQSMAQDLLKMIDFEHNQGWGHDVNIYQMSLIAQKYLGYKTKIVSNPSLAALKSYLSQNIPIIVPANGKILYQENRHFSNGGPYYHNLVILGYDDSQNQFIVHDVGTQFGAYFRYSYDVLLNSIHDFPSSQNKEDINQGGKNVLVLLK